MTDADIEAIARAYCVKLGLDPDRQTLCPQSGWLMDRWELHTVEVRKAVAMREAIAEVLGEKGVG